MIRFNAAGVQATLSTAALDASLSRSITLTMGKEQMIDDLRVDAHLAAGIALPSAPIGADGSTKGVLQYLGEYGDMPFMMAEAGETSGSAELTSPEPRALRLTVDTHDRTHRTRSQSAAPDLKIEVFVNGALSDVYYFNPKKFGTTQKYATNGIRIQRQIEKPWTYQPSTALSSSKWSASERWAAASVLLKHAGRTRARNQGAISSPSGQFLAALSDVPLPERLRDSKHMGLIDVVVATGKGGKDGPAHGYIARPTPLRNSKDRTDLPSGSVPQPHTPLHVPKPMPSGLENTDTNPESNARPGFGAEDSSSPLPSRPARNSVLGWSADSNNAHFQRPSLADDPFTETPFAGDSAAPASQDGPELLSSSSDIPRAAQQPAKPKIKLTAKSQEPKLTTTEAKAKGFAEAHGIVFNREVVIDGIKNSRGKVIGSSRTITQRISDIQKMTPKNQSAALRKLKEDLDQQTSDPPGQISPDSPVPTRSRSPAKPESPRDCASAMASSTPAPSPLAKQHNPSSITEARTAMALNNGAAPGGRLVARIASYSSPQRSSQSKVQTLPANGESAASTAISTPRPLQTVQRPETPTNGTPAPSDSVKRSRRKRVTLDDQTPEQALANFKLPEMSEGCTVSFAEGNAQRQIQKTRPGFFEEDEMVVGMRFVVV
ncbi:hypothetical protein BST61_g7559 [Cercospora zeina]